MSFGVNAVNSGNALNQISQSQSNLGVAINRLSSGHRINTAADDPSGLAIVNALQGQVNGYDQATANVQTALNATNVAAGALSAISGGLQQLNTLAVAASNDFLSTADRNALQAQANSIVQETNFIASTTTFNGTNLLNGQYAGAQAGTPAQAQVTANAQTLSGGTLVTQVSAANGNFQAPPSGAPQGFGGTSTTDSTISIQVVNNGGQAQAVATVYDNASGQSVQLAPVNSGGVVSGAENVNIQLGSFTTADVGQTTTIQIAAATAPNTQSSALAVQSGANQGATTQIAFAAPSSQQLQISNIDLSSSLSATNAIGQVQNALTTLSQQQANLGAQQVSLSNAIDNNNITSTNLTAAAASIQDTNYGLESTNSTRNQLLVNIATSVLAQNNTQAASVLGLFAGR